MPRPLARDRGVARLRRAAVAEARIRARVLRVAVVRVHDVAGGAAGRAIIAGLVVGAEEPGERIVEPRLVDVEHGHGDARAGAGAAVALADVGPARLLEPLDLAGGVRQSGLGEEIREIAAAVLEHAEDVGRSQVLPARQRIQALDDPVCRAVFRTRRRALEDRGLALARVGLAEDVILERQQAVVVRGAAPEHRDRGHQAALGGDDGLQVAGAAGLAHDAVIRGIHEADELGRLAVQQRVAAHRVRARGPVPVVGEARQHVRGIARLRVPGARIDRRAVPAHAGIAAVAIGAAEDDRGARVHGRLVRLAVAVHAAAALGGGLLVRLQCGCHRRRHPSALDGLAMLVGGDRRQPDGGGEGAGCDEGMPAHGQ